jgi:hypothetical protein
MDILPAEYGIAGYLSVVRRGDGDCSEDYERALIGAATQSLVRERLKRTRDRDDLMMIAMARELSRLRPENEALAAALRGFDPGAVESAAPGLVADLADISSLRRENKGLRESLNWHAEKLEELTRVRA